MATETPDPQSLALGQRLQRLREKVGMTQQDLAKRLGYHVNSVARWERGEQNLKAIEVPVIAAALTVATDVLLGVREARWEHAAPRTATTFLVLDDAIAAVRAAESIEDLRALFQFGIRVAIEVEPTAREVTPEQYGAIASEVRAKLAALGGIPRDWS